MTIMTMDNFRANWKSRAGKPVDLFYGTNTKIEHGASWASSVVLTADLGVYGTPAKMVQTLMLVDWCRTNCTGRWEKFDGFTLLFEFERDAILCELFHEEDIP